MNRFFFILMLIFVFCNDQIINAVIQRPFEGNRKTVLNGKQLEELNQIWRKRKKISGLGSPHTRYFSNKEEYIIVRIVRSNGKELLIEIKGAIAIYNNNFYMLPENIVTFCDTLM